MRSIAEADEADEDNEGAYASPMASIPGWGPAAIVSNPRHSTGFFDTPLSQPNMIALPSTESAGLMQAEASWVTPDSERRFQMSQPLVSHDQPAPAAGGGVQSAFSERGSDQPGGKIPQPGAQAARPRVGSDLTEVDGTQSTVSGFSWAGSERTYADGTQSTVSGFSAMGSERTEGFGTESKEAKNEDEKLGDTVYSMLQVGLPLHKQIWNDARYCCKHRRRADDYHELLSPSIASRSERTYVEKETNIEVREVVNMLVWRRSILKTVLVVMVLYFIYFGEAVGRSVLTLIGAMTQEDGGFQNGGFEIWQSWVVNNGLEGGFENYSLAVLSEVMRLLTERSNTVTVLTGAVILLAYLIAIGFVLAAGRQWTGGVSRKCVLSAWVIWTGAPFLGSIIAPKLFVDWTAGDAILAQFTTDLGEQIEFSKDRVPQINAVCEDFREVTEPTPDQIKAQIEKVCHWSSFLPTTLWLPKSSFMGFNRYDFSQVKDGCASAREEAESGSIEKARQDLFSACDELANQKVNIEETSPETAQYVISRSSIVLHTIIIFKLVLQNMQVLLPAALSIAPGFVQGALLMKLLVPQSCIPGIMILLLPWVYGPLVWSLYSVVFQVIGDRVLFFGLSCFALGPFIFSFIGLIYRLDIPMSDAMVKQAVKDVQTVQLYSLLLGIALVVIYVVLLLNGVSDSPLSGEMNWLQEEERRFLREHFDFNSTWEDILNQISFSSLTTSILAMLIFYFCKYYLSSVAALDFMLSATLSSYQQECEMQKASQICDAKKSKLQKEQAHMSYVLRDRMTSLIAIEGKAQLRRQQADFSWRCRHPADVLRERVLGFFSAQPQTSIRRRQHKSRERGLPSKSSSERGLPSKSSSSRSHRRQQDAGGAVEPSADQQSQRRGLAALGVSCEGLDRFDSQLQEQQGARQQEQQEQQREQQEQWAQQQWATEQGPWEQQAWEHRAWAPAWAAGGWGQGWWGPQEWNSREQQHHLEGWGDPSTSAAVWDAAAGAGGLRSWQGGPAVAVAASGASASAEVGCASGAAALREWSTRTGGPGGAAHGAARLDYAGAHETAANSRGVYFDRPQDGEAADCHKPEKNMREKAAGERHRRVKDGLEQETQLGEDSYKEIEICSSVFEQAKNDLKCFCKHFQRTNSQMDLLCSRLETKSEREKIKESAKGDVGVSNMVIINMMVWRRSILKVTTVFMFFFVCLFSLDVWAYLSILWKVREPFITSGFADWAEDARKSGSPETFADYSAAFISEFYSRLTWQSNIAVALTNIVILCGYMTAMMLVQGALKTWTRGRSRGYVLGAWLIWVAAPFLGSLVPAKLFVTWSAGEPLVNQYTNDLEVQVQRSDVVQQVDVSCSTIESTGTITLEYATRAVEKVCRVINALPADIWVPNFSLISWRQVDLSGAHSNCASAQGAIDRGSPEEALSYVLETCSQTKEATQMILALSPQTVSYMMTRTITVLEFTITLSLALQNLQVILPAAMSVAPGLLQGSVLMKLILPQSCVPGIMVIALPWVFAPLVWTLYSLVFQLVGDFFLFIGLAAIAITPFTYVAIGKIYRMDTPMTDGLVLKATTDIRWTESALLYTCVICLVIYVVQLIVRRGRYSGVIPGEDEWLLRGEMALVDHISDSGNFMTASVVIALLKMIVFFFAKLYLSSIAAMDFMVGTLVESYSYESHFRATIEAHRKGLRKGDSQKELMALQMHERMEGLMAMKETKFRSVYDQLRQPKVLAQHIMNGFGNLFRPTRERGSSRGDGIELQESPSSKGSSSSALGKAKPPKRSHKQNRGGANGDSAKKWRPAMQGERPAEGEPEGCEEPLRISQKQLSTSGRKDKDKPEAEQWIEYV